MDAAATTSGVCRLVGGACVAYAEAGRGSPLVMVPGWLSHLEQSWEHPAAASARRKLASTHRFLWYDRLGCGLSDRDGFDLSLENDVEQLTSVFDTAGIERASVIGYSFGVPPAALFAARHPERVDRLVLYSGFARGSAMMPRESLEAVTGLIRADWNLATRLLATHLLPNASSKDLAWFDRFQQVAAYPDTAASLLEHTWSMDVRGVLGEIRAPTLVAHNRDDQAMPLTAGEELAALVRGARLHVLDGNEHDPFIRDSGSVVEVILDFVAGRPLRRPAVPSSPQAQLTAREREVLRLLASGSTNEQIASTRAVAVKTVERHVSNIYRKLGAGGRADATRAAVALELVRPSPVP
jgi:pimeloyl-ACP methyl ester carboxylesterase/DNA-binding CsgD family transcriptional regulator